MSETACPAQNTTPAPAGRPSVRTALRTARDPALTMAAVAVILAAVAGVGPFAPAGAPTTVIARLDR